MSDIRDWLAVHCPDALPWQVDYVEAIVATDREGLQRPIPKVPVISAAPSTRVGAAKRE